MEDLPSIALVASKTSLMIGVVGAIALMLARRSAACRHFLWVSALALSLMMPLAILFVPAIAVIPASWHASTSALLGAPAFIDGAAVVPDEERSGGAPVPMILIVWCAGALLFLLRDAFATVGLHRWVRRAVPLRSPSWIATLQRVSRVQEGARPMRVLESSHVASPCTWGLVRPVLLLPGAGARWSEAQRRHALLHELAHIRRLDYLSTLIARLACALHWYNPLAWFAAAQVRRLQEEACDDAVLRAGETPSDYAEGLLSIAAQAHLLPYPARTAICMFHRSPLNDRIAAILEPRRKRAPLSVLTLLAAAVPVSCLMLLVAAAAVAKPPQARSSMYSAAPLFASDVEPTGGAERETPRENDRPASVARPNVRPENEVATSTRVQPAPAPAPSARLVPHERQHLEPLPEIAPLPTQPAIVPVPVVPAVPAIPAVPAVPAELPELPALAQLPALPRLPQLSEESGST